MNPSEFNDVYLHVPLQNLGNNNKQIVLMGDFNIGMLKHDKNKDNATFLDSICSKFLLPYIMAPSHHISQTTQKSHLTLEHKLAIYFPIVLTMKFLQAIQHQQLLIMLLNSS